MSELDVSGFSFSQLAEPGAADSSARATVRGSAGERRAGRLFPAIFAASVVVHAFVALRVASGASEHPVRPPSKVEIEVIRPPRPTPPPLAEPPRPSPEVLQAKPVARVPSRAPAQKTVTSPPPASMAGVPEGDEGTLPPAPPTDPGPVISAAPVAAPVAPPAPPAPPPPVIAAKEGANYLKNPRPAYPRVAKREGWEGRVTLRVHVLPSGRVESSSVQGSSGRTILDDAASDAVRGWTFAPATQGGQPVAGWVTVPIDFRLQ